MEIHLTPIRIVRNERLIAQDDYWGQVISEITLSVSFNSSALSGLDQYSHVEIIYYFHLADKNNTIFTAKHPRERQDWPLTGIFGQRTKDRPNHLGTCICELIKIEDCKIVVKGLDAINHTPVLDIKPVMKEFLPEIKSIEQPGWNAELMKNYW